MPDGKCTWHPVYFRQCKSSGLAIMVSLYRPAAAAEHSPCWGWWHCGPRTWGDALRHGGEVPARTGPGGTCGAWEEKAAKISSHPSQADTSAGGRRTQPKETVLWGWSQPSLLQGSLWGTEGLMCISHPACSCHSPAVLGIIRSWFRQQEGDTSLQNKVRDDGEQLSPKLGSKPCASPPLCKVLWLLPLLASRIVFLWCQFIVTLVYTPTSSQLCTKTALDTLTSWKMLAGTQRPYSPSSGESGLRRRPLGMWHLTMSSSHPRAVSFQNFDLQSF